MIQVNKPKSVCNNLKRNIYYKITNTSENYQNCKVHKYSKESKFVTIVIIFIKDKIEMMLTMLFVLKRVCFNEDI